MGKINLLENRNYGKNRFLRSNSRHIVLFGIIGMFLLSGLLPLTIEPVYADELEVPDIILYYDYFDLDEIVGTFDQYIALYPVLPFQLFFGETHKYFVPNTPETSPSSDPMLLIFVNSSIYFSVRDDIYFYCAKLEYIGYDTVVIQVSGGDATDLKNTILNYWPTYNVVGSILVGDLPAAWYYHEHDFDHDHDGDYDPDEFPCDLYFMDLDGTWTDTDVDGMYDSHTAGSGDKTPEIYIARIDASKVPGNEISILEDYFDKIHKYWTGIISGPNTGLSYIDHDWAGSSEHMNSIGNAYSSYTPMNWTPTANEVFRNDYVNTRLPNVGYEFIHLSCHSGSYGHSFHEGGTAWRGDVRNAPPIALFYNLFCCSSLRFTDNDCVGFAYILNTPGKGLTVVGSSKSGSMTQFDDFYTPFGTGESFGDAFKEWFIARAPYTENTVHGNSVTSWSYGMTIFGDPTLYKSTFMPGIDTTPPTTTIEFGTPKYPFITPNYIKSTTTVYINSTDNSGGIGVKDIYYRFNSGDSFTVVSSNTTFTIPTECIHTIEYYAVDDLGNKETINSNTISVDDSDPVTTNTFIGPNYSDSTDNWVKSTTIFDLDATDYPSCTGGASGVKNITFKIDSVKTVVSDDEASFSLSVNDCHKYEVEWYATDNLGNDETITTDYYYVDDSAPTTTIEFGGKYINDAEGEWITPDTTIYINATDHPICKPCGVKEVNYSIDGTWYNFIGSSLSFNIPEILGQCERELQWYAVDKLGNKGVTMSKTLIVDGTPPEITLSSEEYKLWPPKHDYYAFEVPDFIINVVDNCDPDVDINDVDFTNVSSDEPEEYTGMGDGKTYDDIVIIDSTNIMVRAERQEYSNGRVYNVSFSVSDRLGNEATGSYIITVNVFKNVDAIDDGADAGYIVFI